MGLTELHHLYLLTCIECKNYKAALKILDKPITHLDKDSSKISIIIIIQSIIYFF